MGSYASLVNGFTKFALVKCIKHNSTILPSYLSLLLLFLIITKNQFSIWQTQVWK